MKNIRLYAQSTKEFAEANDKTSESETQIHGGPAVENRYVSRKRFLDLIQEMKRHIAKLRLGYKHFLLMGPSKKAISLGYIIAHLGGIIMMNKRNNNG